ncbi:MAG TPA: hypothetical protein VFH66_07225, partial [Mycobacteriales bacterium]|nr:hypothetical protein [Mycobacteriales bacterium]
MHDRRRSRTPRAGLRTAALLPVAVVAWMTMGTGTAMAAPSVHAAAAATAAQTAHSSSSASSDHSAGNAGTAGDPSQPQPVSNADQNPGGANGQCTGATYCSTRDGSPSMNGNGGGKATGKPCAGCVGKADNKNPPGQEKTDPYGTFPNNGYEC